MDKESFKTCCSSWDGDYPLSEEVELAAILTDVSLKKRTSKRLLILKDTPENISFISKLYFPLKTSRQGDLSFVLGTSFFSRNIRDYKLDKKKIESSINNILENGITIENLKGLRVVLGGKGFFDEMVKKENYAVFHIKGGYPDKYPSNFMDEFKFIENIFNLQQDGIVFQQGIPDHMLEDSSAKLKIKLEEIESDIRYIKEKKATVSSIVDALNKQKDEADERYKQLHAKVLEDCNTQDINASINTTQTISVIEKEFESGINMFAKYYPALLQGLANPAEFGEWAGLAPEIYRYQKSDRKFQVLAADLLSKIKTCRSIVNRLKPDQGQLHPQIAGFIDQVYEMTNETEKQLYRQLSYAKDEIKEIWAKEEVVKKEWNSAVKKIQDRVESISKEQEEILKRLDLILSRKNSTIEEIKTNIALPVNSLPECVYIPFWVACLSRHDESRFLVYGPMKKKGDKGLTGTFQSYTNPLEPYSKGIERLRSEIENKLNRDKKLARKVTIEGIRFNRINVHCIDLVSKGLEVLKNEGWLKSKQAGYVIDNMKFL